ncbi:MAG: hypothetical protein KBD66_03970, partial [Candidatus Doudnabacteria bacterium]|nr:hypothetical protein [Candidatus Doudnabacteria bacterium]
MIDFLIRNPTIFLYFFWLVKMYTLVDAAIFPSDYIPAPFLAILTYIIFGIFEALIYIQFEYDKDPTARRKFMRIVFSPLAVFLILYIPQ